MVCGQGTDFADAHDLMPGNADWIAKPVYIPELEECDVQAYVRWVQEFVMCDSVEKAGQVFDVIHDRSYLELNNVLSELTLFCSSSLSMSCWE